MELTNGLMPFSGRLVAKIQSKLINFDFAFFLFLHLVLGVQIDMIERDMKLNLLLGIVL